MPPALPRSAGAEPLANSSSTPARELSACVARPSLRSPVTLATFCGARHPGVFRCFQFGLSFRNIGNRFHKPNYHPIGDSPQAVFSSMRPCKFPRFIMIPVTRPPFRPAPSAAAPVGPGVTVTLRYQDTGRRGFASMPIMFIMIPEKPSRPAGRVARLWRFFRLPRPIPENDTDTPGPEADGHRRHH